MNNKKNTLRDQLNEIFNDLAKRLGAPETAKTIKDYLKTIVKFHKYSPNNVLLMMHFAEKQGFQIERVASFNKWQTFKNPKGENAHVLKKAKGLPVFVPIDIIQYQRDKTTGKFVLDNKGHKIPWLNELGNKIKKRAFKQGCVFDIKQTNAKEIGAYQSLEFRDMTKDISILLLEDITGRIEEEYQIKVNFKPVLHGNGNYDYIMDEINISDSSDMTPANKLSTLFHELGHKILHGEKLKNHEISYVDEHNQRGFIEGEAEGFSFALASMYGIDNKSELYLASWSNTPEDLKTRMQMLSKAVKGAISKLKLGEYVSQKTTIGITEDLSKRKGTGISM